MKLLAQIKSLLNVTDFRLLEIAAKNNPSDYYENSDENLKYSHLLFDIEGCKVKTVELVLHIDTTNDAIVAANLFIVQ
jgi:hypothetical protein